jgi:hypothetical protein
MISFFFFSLTCFLLFHQAGLSEEGRKGEEWMDGGIMTFCSLVLLDPA